MIGFSGILGPDGRPITAERVRLEKQTRFNPLVNWTPDVLTRQLAAWARGEIRDLAWTMQWLEDHDDIISTVAPKAKAAVSREGYDVELKAEIPDNLKGMAEDQRGVLQEFYDSVEAGDAIDGDLQGGFRLMANQVMDGYGKRWSSHHLVWNRSRSRLGCTAIQVPLWYWEATEGRLRFLQNHGDVRGVERETMGGPSAWMVSRGRGVMLACAIAAMFKRIPLQDWLTYCDRHGMPAFLGKTTAQKGSPGWDELFRAVASIGSEFGGVVNTQDAIEVLDLTSKGELPYEKLVDRMDRACVMLWRGGDLATISRQNGVGSNPQQEETDDLDADNAMWVGETIDRSMSRPVIDFHFGYHVPQLAKLKLRTKTRENVTQDLKVLDTFVRLGERVSRSWATSKFGVVLADEGEEALGQSAGTVPQTAPVAINTVSPQILEEVIAKALEVPAEFLDHAKPLITRLAAGVQDSRMTDAQLIAMAEELATELPEFVAPDSTEALARSLEAGMAATLIDGARDGIRDTKP